MLASSIGKCFFYPALFIAAVASTGCNGNNAVTNSSDTAQAKSAADSTTYLSQPLVTNMYIADPSAHVFNGTVYIYPSHDTDTGAPEKDDGSHFDMRDYHIYSMDSIPGPAIDHGVALDIKNIPWAKRQLWAPDAAFKEGTYYLYFPVKDKQDVFRIGVATGSSPISPFKAQPNPIEGSFSIDPAVFMDDDNNAYMYFGGIWGGQLQRWQSGKYDSTAGQEPTDTNADALTAKVAKMSKDMLHFDGPVRDVVIVDENGKPLKAGDHNRRFFEASWMHKYNGKYYFSYSTGDTHNICYAIGDNPYGPFTYKGIILYPVQGWTNHESIISFKGKWYIFYHDTQLSGKTHLRNVKVAELHYNPDGTIVPVRTYTGGK
ncbi:alpha-N-arabinofuranosidase [Ilyomonas limi]|uniref:Alpha-N-arabinofuranosidase n=1 Tax=Ilyomonas limi TaxID=2575867 RepID=A0A4U3KW31_9BACT|nr:glycoside hydrolase family 43 protein [Ilyomonas limi]TKK66610.1 alpha-N-arabinofuranosidase [Ilyomonas limi]